MKVNTNSTKGTLSQYEFVDPYFDASDKLSDNKNNNETGNLANIGDEVDEGEPVDEKELLIQRRYREIPDDVGGLLREMIKKEHFKGRYKNEKM